MTTGTPSVGGDAIVVVQTDGKPDVEGGAFALIDPVQWPDDRGADLLTVCETLADAERVARSLFEADLIDSRITTDGFTAYRSLGIQQWVGGSVVAMWLVVHEPLTRSDGQDGESGDLVGV